MIKSGMVILFALFAGCVWAQSGDNYYVIIGAFRQHDNAIRLTQQAGELNLMADYALSPRGRWHFVYVLQTEDRERALRFLANVKATTPFRDAWIFSGVLGQTAIRDTGPAPK